MNAVLKQYQSLTDSNHTKRFGCQLPKLEAGSITITNKTCAPAELAAELSAWHSAQGWYQLADVTALGMPEQLATLLEGQWATADASLHLRRIAIDQYQLTIFRWADAPNDHQCYQEQVLLLRGNLCGTYDALRYRLWWQQQEGAWKPYAQQFIGLTHQGGN